MRSLAFAALVMLCACPSSGSSTFRDAGGSNAHDAAIDAPADAGSGDIITGSGCTHEFQLFGYGGVSSVWLSGDFVGWAATPGSGAIPMTLDPATAAWEVVHTFGSGTFQYKFVIDGSMWIADPTNSDVVDDGYGGVNSIYVCTPSN